MERHDPNDPTRPQEESTREEPTREEPTREEPTQEEPTGEQDTTAVGSQPPPGGAQPPGEGGHPPPGGGQPPPPGGPEQPPGGPEPPPEPAAAAPRRLLRSRDDRVLGGVCGGLGRYLRVDQIILRIVFLVLLFFGGVSLVAYLIGLLLIPNEPEGGAPAGVAAATTAAGAAGAPPAGRGRTVAIVAGIILLLIGWPILLGGGLALAAVALPLAMLALAGLLVWWVVSGEGFDGGPGELARRSALGVAVLLGCVAVFVAGAWAAGVGDGVVAASIVIAAGAVLVVGAFLGRARLLLLPAVALALGVGLVSAANIDLSGGIGEREYAPTSAAELRDEYELGMGELVVDLRDADLPPGDTQLAMRVGVGEAALLVPRDVCVASTATVGAGNVASFGRDNGGVDLDWEDTQTAAPRTSRLVVDADVGFGEFRVQHGPYLGPGPENDDHGPPFLDRDEQGGPSERQAGNVACEGDTASVGAGG